MIRKVFSMLPVMLMGFGLANAQDRQLPCVTTEVHDSYKESFPEIEAYEKQLRAYLDEAMKQINVDRLRGKGTIDNETLHIPVVVHIVHDYDNGGNDYVSDDNIYRLMDDINEVYLKRNADTTQVIAPFKKYIGNPNIMFHLATRDPLGRPTTGITRRQSQLSNGGDDQAKFDQWDPSTYLNIWTIRRIGRGISNGVVAAYAVFPSDAGAFPYTDGIITSAGSMFSNKTIPHEIGHILGLYHTWGNIAVSTNCTGDDEVDDTPPTTGHFGNGAPFGVSANGNCDNNSLFDTACTNNVQRLAKILLDNTAAPRVDYAVKGFDYIPRTGITVEAIKIYPASIGSEYEITNYKYNRGSNSYVPVNVIGTSREAVGKTALGSNVVVRNVAGKDSATAKVGMAFDALKYTWIDSVVVYPSTIGDTFTVTIRKFNGDTVKTYTDTTRTASGPQVVPIRAFIMPANNYTIKMDRNPGLYSDSLDAASRTAIDSVATTALTIKTFADPEGYSTTPDYQGAYNFFYDWKVRFDALTTTDSGSQEIPLNFKVVPDTTFRLTLTKNPGVYNDSVLPSSPYVKSIECVLDVSNDVTNNRYNLLYDLRVRYGYIKNCVDYPDTVNTQNIMDYANCPINFTPQQVERMRGVLGSSVGNRDRLVQQATHVRAGIYDEATATYGKRLDLKPVPDVSVERNPSSFSQERTFFLCAGRPFYFKNRSWRDTLQSVEVSFNKNATTPSVTLSTPAALNGNITNSFGEAGWVDVTVKAAGNNTGDTTITMKSLVYAADSVNKINPQNGFYMEFNKDDANNPLDKWPVFNYYNNPNKWEMLENVGYYDNSSIVYRGFDKRDGPEAYTNSPKYDVDDFFTPAFDLSNMTGGECRLNFMSSGAQRVNDSRLLKDELQISYSNDCGQNWTALTTLTRTDLANKGLVSIEYSPLHQGDWELKSYNIPQSGRTDKVFFRFRFKPWYDSLNGGMNQRILRGTGNNFFIDRINISSFSLGTNTLLTGDKKIALAPNPTHGGTQLVIKSDMKEEAQVVVTDITGKVVYRTSKTLNGSLTTVDIPASVIQVRGVYMVQVTAGYERYSEKLVSY